MKPDDLPTGFTKAWFEDLQAAENFIAQAPPNLKNAAIDRINTKSRFYARQDPKYKPKYYISLELGLAAYINVLEDGGTVDEALTIAATTLNEKLEDVLGAKHRPFFYTKEVVKKADEHPKQKSMLKDKTLSKFALKKAKTLSEQLNLLINNVSIHNKLVELREAQVVADNRITELEDKMDFVLDKSGIESDKQKVIAAIENIKSNKDKCQLLRNAGFTVNEVCGILGKSKSTIMRYGK